MIVIVEGVDRVGKTTLCKELEKRGFIYFKDKWNLIGEDVKKFDQDVSLGKIDTTLSLFKMLSDSGQNVVVDRFHLTEKVYGELSRGYRVYSSFMREIERKLLKISNTALVLVVSENIEQSSKEAHIDLREHEIFFYREYIASNIKFAVTSYSNISTIVRFLHNEVAEYDFYFASPFFTKEQIEREEYLKQVLREKGFTVFSPKENFILRKDSPLDVQQAIFKQNLNAINRSKAVFAVTDGKDVGTIWEAGFAFALSKPICYFCESLNGAPFNVMLGQSGVRTFTSSGEITEQSLRDALQGIGQPFEGAIE